MLVYINWGCMFFSRFIIMNSYQKLRTSHQLQLANSHQYYYRPHRFLKMI